jgi:hypothetical protein
MRAVQTCVVSNGPALVAVSRLSSEEEKRSAFTQDLLAANLR